ncbi:hypothetical protein LTR53_015775 [Teratosphaeriaceae sp. CCFEE 6253]|nr:hypothetical protein LTR53_015775 [Teratosphaeriaceae sp. CCFEE 6253]
MTNTYYSVPESCSRPRPLSDTQYVSLRDAEMIPNASIAPSDKETSIINADISATQKQHNAEAQGDSTGPVHNSEPQKALHAPAEVTHTSPPASGSAESATEGAAISAPPRALAARACHERLPRAYARDAEGRWLDLHCCERCHGKEVPIHLACANRRERNDIRRAPSCPCWTDSNFPATLPGARAAASPLGRRMLSRRSKSSSTVSSASKRQNPARVVPVAAAKGRSGRAERRACAKSSSWSASLLTPDDIPAELRGHNAAGLKEAPISEKSGRSRFTSRPAVVQLDEVDWTDGEDEEMADGSREVEVDEEMSDEEMSDEEMSDEEMSDDSSDDDEDDEMVDESDDEEDFEVSDENSDDDEELHGRQRMDDLTTATHLLAAIEQLLTIEGHLFITHKPPRPPPLPIRRSQADLPPSLALFPDISLEQHLRDHDHEVASLKACLASASASTHKCAHTVLASEYMQLDASLRSAGYEKLGLQQKLIALRRAQAQALEADDEDFAVIAITGVSEWTGLPTSQQTYHLPIGVSWIGMQDALKDMTTYALRKLEGVTEQDRWQYQLAGDTSEKGIKPLRTAADYDGMRKRMHADNATSVLVWHDRLCEASREARARAAERKTTTLVEEDDSAEYGGWALWDPLAELDGESEPYELVTEGVLDGCVANIKAAMLARGGHREGEDGLRSSESGED